jgi:hypothetical protein
VVTIVKVSTGSPSAGLQRSHSPAKPKTWRLGKRDREGLLPARHALPLEESRGGDDAAALLDRALNAGFASTPSERALIIFVPMARLFAQKGTSPHRAIATSRAAPSFVARTMGASCVGAMLKRLRSRSSTVTANGVGDDVAVRVEKVP